MALHKTPQRYKATFTGEGSTVARTDPGAPKQEVKKGESINVHAAIASQYKGYSFWTVEPLAMGVKDEKVVENNKKENEATAEVKAERVAEQKALENQPGSPASRPLQAHEVGEKEGKESEASKEANEKEETINKPTETKPKTGDKDRRSPKAKKASK